MESVGFQLKYVEVGKCWVLIKVCDYGVVLGSSWIMWRWGCVRNKLT